MSLYRKVHISGIRTETPDAKTFVLAASGPEPLQYEAGQFLTIAFAGLNGEERRSYSFSSSPALGEPPSITVKRVENGAWSRTLLDHARTGDELSVIGPSGFFTLPDPALPWKRLFFIAAGSGITPVYALIKTALHTHPHVSIVLVYANRSAAGAIFHDELRALADRHPGRFHIEWLFSESPNLARARLSKWLLGILLKEQVPQHLDDTLFYLCGPFEFMRMATIQLTEDGVTAAQIRRENFSTFKIETKAQPPDKDRHRVTIRRDSASLTLDVQYPQSILQAAKSAGIALPYSCEAGRCGSCAATCTKGKVWMSYNEVLLDEELAKGRVLTCTGYPVDGDIELEY